MLFFFFFSSWYFKSLPCSSALDKNSYSSTFYRQDLFLPVLTKALLRLEPTPRAQVKKLLNELVCRWQCRFSSGGRIK